MSIANPETLADALLETVHLPILALDGDLRVQIVNDAFLQHFRVSRDETIGQLVYDLGNGQWNIPELRRLLGEILPGTATVVDYRIEHSFERIGLRIIRVSARRIVRADGDDLILLAFADDTERESLRAELLARIELADKVIDSLREGLLILDPDLRVRSASAAFYTAFAATPEQTLGRRVYELGNGQWDIPDLRRLLEEILPKQKSFDDYEVIHTFEKIGRRVMILNGRRLDHLDMIVLAIRDVTDSHENHARLREVSAAAHIGVFATNLATGTRYWSPELREILDYPQDQPPPDLGCVPDFIHPDDREAVAALIRRMSDPTGDGAIFHEHRILRPDGTVRWVQLHGQVEFADSGRTRPVLIRGVLLDVSDQKAASEQLRESEARQAFLLDLSDALRPLGEPSEVLRVATRLLGERLGATRAFFVEWPPGEAYSLVSPDYAAPGVASRAGRYPATTFRATYDHLAKGETWVVPDVALVTELGEAERSHFSNLGIIAWVDVPLVKDGRLRAALCLVQDRPRQWCARELALAKETADRCWSAFEQVRAEALQRESEARYRQLFNSITQGFCVIEMLFDANDHPHDYRFLDVNSAFERQTGLSDVVGKTMRELAPETGDHWFETFGRVALTREPESLEGVSEASGRHYEVYAFPFGEPEDRKLGVLFNDISDRKRAEGHQNMLMAELDHRVKNILAVVQSITRQSLGRGQYIGPEAAQRLIGRISALARSHTLLAKSRWEGARFLDLMEDAVAPYRGEDPDRVTLDGPALTVTPKAAQTLTLALHELVTNAVKYGALSRRAGRVAAHWHVDGPPGQRNLVFTWQERGGPPIDTPPTRKGFGSRLIEMTLAYELGGKVTQDFAPDGLSAVITLPLAAITAEGSQRGNRSGNRGKHLPTDPVTLRGRSVLVVEDDYLVGHETTETLRSAGCLVLGPVRTIADAMRLAVSAPLDAAVLDINLDGEMVWPVAKTLSARGIPFAFATGYSDTIQTPPDLAKAPKVEKPLAADRLIATLTAAVASARQSGDA